MSTLTTTIKYNYNYDSEDDILYLSIGEPEPSITKEIEEGIFVRKSIKTKRITGITILDYKFRKKNKMKINVPEGINLDNIKL